MPDLAYGRGAYQRTRGNLPELSVINMFVEASRSEQRQIVMQSRKGLVEDAEVGTGPIRGTFERDGVFNGDRFAVSGTALYRGTTDLGDIDGDGPVYFAAVSGELLVCAGGGLWSYNGTNLAEVTFPDSANVTAVGYSSGYFIALRADTEQWYFALATDGRTWDGLDFASAEVEPDRLLDFVILDGSPVFAGPNSVEFWTPTGDSNAPFAPISLRSFEQGVYSTGCMVAVDNTFFFIGADRILYRNDNVPQAVADDGIVERMAGSTSLRLFLIEDERHKFVCVRGDTFTVALDVSTNEWCEFQSYGRTNFRCGPGMGDDETGIIWRFEGYADNGGPLERRIRAGAQLTEPLRVANLRLVSEVGTTSFASGEYAEPVIEMRLSNDAGSSWGSWDETPLGAQGEYRERVEWRALGMFDDPGMLAEFRVTAPVSWRLSGVEIQAAGGGRARA